MAHFAEVENGIVKRVIVASQETIDSGIVGDPQNWVQTSYNTRRGIHLLGETPLRKNYAGVGYSYDKVRDAFIPPKPFKSWVLNEEKGLYEPPIAKPREETTGVHKWNETEQKWDKVVLSETLIQK